MPDRRTRRSAGGSPRAARTTKPQRSPPDGESGGSLLPATDEAFCVIQLIFDDQDRPIDYRFVETNAAFERSSGMVDVEGKSIRELLPRQEHRWYERYGRIASSGVPMHFEDRAAGLDRWFDVSAWRVGEPRDRLVAVSFRDITQRKRAMAALRESERRLRLAKDAADLGIHDFDPVTGQIRWDERVRAIWGIGKDEPIDYGMFMARIHPDDQEATQAAVDRALDPAGDGEYRAEYRVTSRSDGRTRWVAATGRVTFEHGRAVRMVGSVQDITARKHVEAELRDALAAKDQFLGFISHELRTPMTIVLGMSRLLAGSLPDGSEQSLAADIATSAEELNDIIDSLLTLARLAGSHGPHPGSPTHLGHIIERVLERQRVRHPNREFRYRPDATGLTVDGEEAWLERVLANLVGNATKYSAFDQPVTILVENATGEVLVRVLDEGDGIRDDEIERLFEPFYRGASHEAQTQGAGIGLTVSKRIVEVMGGRMWARRRPTGGAEFGFSVPLLSLEP